MDSSGVCVAITNITASGVYEISAVFHLRKQLVVEEILGFRVKRRVDRDHVTDLGHVFDIGMPSEVEFLLDRRGEPMPIAIMKMHVERFQSARYREADVASATVPTCMPSTS